MHGWFQKLLNKVSSSSREKEAEPKKTPTKPPESQSALNSRLRWSRKYDVLVCYSSEQTDTEEAVRLVSFLEASPRSLRCFLWHRDASPGTAISTELCQAFQDSHCRALLITPNFLQDDWCKYMMHQALSESSRMIPMIQNLSHPEYPLELKFFFYIDLSKNTDSGYTRVSKTVLKYMEDQVKKEQALDRNTDSSSNEVNEGGSSQVNQQMSKRDTADSSHSLQVTKNTDESFTEL